MQCPSCNYKWENRKVNPKECPRCKCRLDTERKAKDTNIRSTGGCIADI